MAGLVSKIDIVGEETGIENRLNMTGIESAANMEKLKGYISGNITNGEGTQDKKLRVMICGTHYAQYNGYSRVVYELLRRLQHKEDLSITLWGFQNNADTRTKRDPLDHNKVIIVDAATLEQPPRAGFGEVEIGPYVKANPQDIIIIYNDMSVTSALAVNILASLGPERDKVKLVSYIDQVYLHQKPKYLNLLSGHFDHIIAFTDYWKKVLLEQNIRQDIPVDILPHGFNHDMYYCVPRKVARLYFNMDQDTFYILNLNRNQPRKRWDICCMVIAEIAKMHKEAKRRNSTKVYRPVRLLIGTSMNMGWDIREILEREFRKRGMAPSEVDDYTAIVPKPQQLTDDEVNLLYNACDVGINTCDGEGFGLCNFEQAALGIPQVVPYVGGFRDFFDTKNSIMVPPKQTFYVDNSRDAIGGEAEVCDYADFAQAIWKYYINPTLVAKHGQQARKDIISNYKWDDIAEHLYKVIHSIHEKKTTRPKNVPMPMIAPGPQAGG